MRALARISIKKKWGALPNSVSAARRNTMGCQGRQIVAAEARVGPFQRLANVLARPLHMALALLLSAFLVACGGGGGGGGGSTPSSGTSGSIVKGPVANATVRLYSLDLNGVKTLLATTGTNATGGYQFNVTPSAGTVLLVEASGGSYVDEVTGQPTALSGDFRAVGVANGGAVRMSVSPFSEAVVAEIAATPGDWSAARVRSVNATMADWLGVANLLDFRPVELHGGTAEANAIAASDDDWFMALQLGGFSGLLQRAGGPMSLPQGIDVLRTMMNDPDDDRYTTPYLLGIVDFIDTTGLSADIKRSLKGSLVLDNSAASDAQINAALPTGQATGSASAPMPDNAFELVPDLGMARQVPIETKFNNRGALIAHQNNAGDPSFYRIVETASVGEVFGDGEVGIGRWHGGFVSDVVDDNGNSRTVNRQYYAATDGLPYAVAIPATNLPTCGVRSLRVAAQTLPVQTAGPGIKPVSGLTTDSSVSVQYLGQSVYIALDVGLRLADGSTYRVTTAGGIQAPWSSGFSVPTDRSFSLSVAPAATPQQLAGLRLDANGTLAGSGGRKAGMMLRVYLPSADAETLAAAFIAPDVPPDSSGCAIAVDGDGSRISPAPSPGLYQVFLGSGISGATFFAAPMGAEFHDNGALKSAGFNLQTPMVSIPATSATFELAGNSQAAIGRASGPFTLQGTSYGVSLPFAVAKAHAEGTYPVAGTRRYRLLNATAPVALVGGSYELAPGEITGAILQLDFEHWPMGTVAPQHGSADLRISGNTAGSAFSLEFPFSPTPESPQYFRASGVISGTNGDDHFDGVIAGDQFEYAVVSYRHRLGNGVIHGMLLFVAE